jgi:ankyrin repeat protein
LHHGIDVDKADKAGRTPLMWACMDNEPDMVRLLLTSGANVQIQDEGGDDALYYSVWAGGNADIMRQLVAHGFQSCLSGLKRNSRYGVRLSLASSARLRQKLIFILRSFRSYTACHSVPETITLSETATQ